MVLEMAARLKGRNRIGYFRKVAAEFASKIRVHDGVAGILFIGGLVRGFADEFSDLDIVVFLKGKNEGLKKRLIELWLEAEHRHNIEIDFEIHFIEDFMRLALDEADKWEFSKAKIIFDPNEEIRKALTAKLKVSKHFWTKRIVIYAEYLKWYCCPTKKDASARVPTTASTMLLSS
jgi:predicted nucleotidyltransferase